MYFKYNKLIIFALICFLFYYCSVVYAFNGPHYIEESEDPCGICHIPHHAADDLLWARGTENKYEGVKRLCGSCHGLGVLGAKDRFRIFSSSQENIITRFDHVMCENASINGKSVIRTDWSQFPLKEKEGGDGFYCGTCHNPHQDPFDPEGDKGGGDYLREETKGNLSNHKNKVFKFCIQCHEDIIEGAAYGHGSKEGCFDCHHPHNSPNPGSKIIITKNQSFKAEPNVPSFSGNDELQAACYGCHKSRSGGSGSLSAPIYADDSPNTREHHPMGRGADSSMNGHQKTIAGPLSDEEELVCSSCHSVHNGTNDRYLNPSVIFKYDPDNSGQFCVACHSDKNINDLGERGKNHHQVAPFNQCLFCHSIHNSPNNEEALYQTEHYLATEENSSVAVDVFMRVEPVNLKWADKNLDIDNRDYEDTCYGCHVNPDIVGREESLSIENALLYDNVRDGYFSHRFNAEASDSIVDLKPFDDDLPIVSDGEKDIVINDYGIEENRIWCGSCHNVHKQGKYFSHYSENFIERKNAYLREENLFSELCKKCHTDLQNPSSNHPMDKGPNNRLGSFSTNEFFPSLFYSGYSGGIGGQTSNDTEYGEIICQTCHSVHTAVTSWDGFSMDKKSQSGYLLVKDNGFNAELNEGSGLCIACHNNDK